MSVHGHGTLPLGVKCSTFLTAMSFLSEGRAHRSCPVHSILRPRLNARSAHWPWSSAALRGMRAHCLLLALATWLGLSTLRAARWLQCINCFARSAVLSADTRRLRAAALRRSLPLPCARLILCSCPSRSGNGRGTLRRVHDLRCAVLIRHALHTRHSAPHLSAVHNCPLMPHAMLCTPCA